MTTPSRTMHDFVESRDVGSPSIETRLTQWIAEPAEADLTADQALLREILIQQVSARKHLLTLAVIAVVFSIITAVCAIVVAVQIGRVSSHSSSSSSYSSYCALRDCS